MNEQKIQIEKGEFRFNVDIYVFREGENYISYCPSLDICSSGRDFIDAVKNFYEAFELYVDYWTEHGTLETDLRAHGWEVESCTARPPRPQALLERPMFSDLMSGDTAFERIVSPVHIAV